MKLVVALDLPTPKENLLLVEQLDGLSDVWVKVGLNTFIAGGPNFVEKLKEKGFPVVLDLKLYDIPTTMANAASRIAELGVDMFTVHASSGEQGMTEVMEAMKKFENPPKVLAVTILTSFVHSHCYEIYYKFPEQKTKELIQLATSCDVDGIVCSVLDAPFIEDNIAKESTKDRFIKFIPGIRFQSTEDDQNRKGGLKEALLAGADFIVVGRPIYQSDDWKSTTRKICEKLATLAEAMLIIEVASKWE